MAAANPDSSEIAPAYLFAGDEEAKLATTLARLRARAEQEGGAGALELFAPSPGSSAGPDGEALVAAIPALSLTASRRYLVADGVERWSAKQGQPVVDALADLPPDVTVVLIAHEQPPRVRAAKRLAEAVESCGGEVRRYEAPRTRQLPSWLAGEARRRGIELGPGAGELLVERIGESTMRLGTELDRLSVWAEPGGRVEREDLEAMIADTSEEVAWAMSDAILDRDPAAAIAAAERLADQGGSVTPLVYQAANRLREANAALEQLERGRSPDDVERDLVAGKLVEGARRLHPYAAKKLVRRLAGRSPRQLRAATCAIADLEWWTRGGSDYPERLALTLAVRRAAGA